MPGCCELGGAAGLAEEAVDVVLGREPAGPEDLDRHGPVQLGVGARNTWPNEPAPSSSSSSNLPSRHGSSAETRVRMRSDRQGPHGLEQSAGESLFRRGSRGARLSCVRSPSGSSSKASSARSHNGAALDVLGDPLERRAGELPEENARNSSGSGQHDAFMSVLHRPDRSSPSWNDGALQDIFRLSPAREGRMISAWMTRSARAIRGELLGDHVPS